MANLNCLYFLLTIFYPAFGGKQTKDEIQSWPLLSLSLFKDYAWLFLQGTKEGSKTCIVPYIPPKLTQEHGSRFSSLALFLRVTNASCLLNAPTCQLEPVDTRWKCQWEISTSVAASLDYFQGCHPPHSHSWSRHKMVRAPQFLNESLSPVP